MSLSVQLLLALAVSVSASYAQAQQSSKNILVIVDFQEDYCTTDGLGWTKDSWPTPPGSPCMEDPSKCESLSCSKVEQSMLELIRSDRYDEIVFTMDWLARPALAEMARSYTSCAAYTRGAQIYGTEPNYNDNRAKSDAPHKGKYAYADPQRTQNGVVLETAPLVQAAITALTKKGRTPTFFKKTTDDWMATLAEAQGLEGQQTTDLMCQQVAATPCPDGDKEQGLYNIDMDDNMRGKNSWMQSADSMRSRNLGELFAAYGYGATETKFTVTGVETTRCVMKGAIHAREAGYQVELPKNATTGNPYNDYWVTYEDARNPPSDGCASASGCNCSSNSEFKPQCAYSIDDVAASDFSDWHRLYFGWQGGPSANDALAYMRAAGVKVV